MVNTVETQAQTAMMTMRIVTVALAVALSLTPKITKQIKRGMTQTVSIVKNVAQPDLHSLKIIQGVVVHTHLVWGWQM